MLDRFLEYSRAVITIQQDASSLKGNGQRLADHLVDAKERPIALEKEVEYLRREVELRDEKLLEQLFRPIDTHLGGTRPKPKRRVFPDKG